MELLAIGVEFVFVFLEELVEFDEMHAVLAAVPLVDQFVVFYLIHYLHPLATFGAFYLAYLDDLLHQAILLLQQLLLINNLLFPSLLLDGFERLGDVNYFFEDSVGLFIVVEGLVIKSGKTGVFGENVLVVVVDGLRVG